MCSRDLRGSTVPTRPINPVEWVVGSKLLNAFQRSNSIMSENFSFFLFFCNFTPNLFLHFDAYAIAICRFIWLLWEGERTRCRVYSHFCHDNASEISQFNNFFLKTREKDVFPRRLRWEIVEYWRDEITFVVVWFAQVGVCWAFERELLEAFSISAMTLCKSVEIKVNSSRCKAFSESREIKFISCIICYTCSILHAVSSKKSSTLWDYGETARHQDQRTSSEGSGAVIGIRFWIGDGYSDWSCHFHVNAASINECCDDKVEFLIGL